MQILKGTKFFEITTFIDRSIKGLRLILNKTLKTNDLISCEYLWDT